MAKRDRRDTPQFQFTPSGNLTFTGTQIMLKNRLGGFWFMIIASRRWVHLAAVIAFAMIIGAMILVTMVLPKTGLTHKIGDILLGLSITEIGASHLFYPRQDHSGTPEEIAQRRRRHLLFGAVFFTAGLVWLAKDIAKFL